MITYRFRENSLPGLLIDVEVQAKNYVDAKRRVLKHIYRHTESALCTKEWDHPYCGAYCNGYTKGHI